MRKTAIEFQGYRQEFNEMIGIVQMKNILMEHGPKKRRPATLSSEKIIEGMVFQQLSGNGTLRQQGMVLRHDEISDSGISQRRATMDWKIFDALMEQAFKPLAQFKKHPGSFYRGMRLVGIDGTQFSVTNTPENNRQLKKAKSRRSDAAFAKIGAAVLVELGMHNPLAVQIATAEQESESVLSERLLDDLPEDCLLIVDRYYGNGLWVKRIKSRPHCECLLRVKDSLNANILEIHPDGSKRVEVQWESEKFILREIRGKVRSAGGEWSSVRFWCSLLDWKKHPAKEMMRLYADRWEQEIFFKELKVEMRSSKLLRGQTPHTAAQEIAALMLAYAVVARQRVKVADQAKVEVTRVSFSKTLVFIQALWLMMEVGSGIMTSQQCQQMTERTMTFIERLCSKPRRFRSCPRGVRQPVSSWPRILKNDSRKGSVEYQTLQN